MYITLPVLLSNDYKLVNSIPINKMNNVLRKCKESTWERKTWFRVFKRPSALFVIALTTMPRYLVNMWANVPYIHSTSAFGWLEAQKWGIFGTYGLPLSPSEEKIDKGVNYRNGNPNGMYWCTTLPSILCYTSLNKYWLSPTTLETSEISPAVHPTGKKML